MCCMPLKKAKNWKLRHRLVPRAGSFRAMDEVERNNLVQSSFISLSHCHACDQSETASLKKKKRFNVDDF